MVRSKQVRAFMARSWLTRMYRKTIKEVAHSSFLEEHAVSIASKHPRSHQAVFGLYFDSFYQCICLTTEASP